MEKAREQFEVYISQNHGWSTAKDSMGNYTRHEVVFAWIGWRGLYLKMVEEAMS